MNLKSSLRATISVVAWLEKPTRCHSRGCGNDIKRAMQQHRDYKERGNPKNVIN
ncbi:hypothetical protein [Rickettsia tamurae]|uniref:hypothetical protein n=1 Tax=Rickettsia tamurae TaxID=334545 RepID=UPI000AFC823A|nr:hypothetical protein [Rickettsia tamurae]